MSGPRVALTAAELDRAGAAGGVFVPTMGALHEGHAALVRRAVELRDSDVAAGQPRRAVVVSVFVNRTQFNDPADYARYPKTLDADLLLCGRAGADVVFVPEHEEVYPPGKPVAVPVLPGSATEPRLEDAQRPGHFAGVCQVVSRLFDLVRPAAAIFGEKDWQQLTVLAEMTRQLQLPIRIIPQPTVREHDGLAMSSRNRFLTAEQRETAPVLLRALQHAGGCPDHSEAERLMHRVLSDAGAQVEYAVVRDARTLLDIRPRQPARALIACRLGSVRLIDNAPWPMEPA